MILFAALLLFVGFSNSFEKEAPKIETSDLIFYNGKGALKVAASDNYELKSLDLYLQENDGSWLHIDSKKSRDKSIELELKISRPELSKMRIKAVAKDASYWMLGNSTSKIIDVVIDSKKPQLSLIEHSYSVEKGGAALAVFSLQEEHLERLWIEVNGKEFEAIELGSAGKYAALLPWDIKDESFKASVFALDKAGNKSVLSLPFFIKNREYRKSEIKLSESFLNGKIAELFDRFNDEEAKSSTESFKFINETLRDKNDKLLKQNSMDIHESKLPTTFKLSVFLPLKNAQKVGDFGDFRTYIKDEVKASTSYHLGLDLASTKEALILLSNPGLVVFAGENGIYGNSLLIYHGLGLYSLYGHCSHLLVQKGDRLNAGAVIAKTGATGLALGDHLHFALLIQGVEVRPQQWMDAKWMRENVFDILKKIAD